jgi:hypothetical protein
MNKSEARGNIKVVSASRSLARREPSEHTPKGNLEGEEGRTMNREKGAG